MLDTVRLQIGSVYPPCGFDDQKWAPVRARYDRYRLRVDLLAPELHHVRVIYDDTRKVLAIEVSLPRLLHGHNVEPLAVDDVDACIETLDLLLMWGFTDCWGVPLVDSFPSVASWDVTRADVFFDFRSPRFPPRAVREALLRLQPSGRLDAHRINDQTAYFRGPSRRKREEITIYDKEAESKGATARARELAMGMMRIEARLFGAHAIRSAFSLGIGRVRLGDLLVPARCGRVLLRALGKLHVREDERTLVTGFDELSARIGASRARRLWPYVERRSRCARRDVCAQLGVSQETGRRWERELRRAGLYPAVVAVAGIHEELLSSVRAAFCVDVSAPDGGTARYHTGGCSVGTGTDGA